MRSRLNMALRLPVIVVLLPVVMLLGAAEAAAELLRVWGRSLRYVVTGK
jgi:hypothetical protein